MKTILLTTGETVKVDDIDFDRVSKYKWYNHQGYAFCTKRTMKVFMHRLILDAKPGEFVDHKDQDHFNNQRTNIRICSWAQNSQNRFKIKKETSSKYKGVSWSKIFGRWTGRIVFNGKEYAKKFEHEINAALWYDKMAKKMFKEFASLNFENGCNEILPKERKFSSKYIGVVWSKDKNKWKSEIRKDGIRYHVGYFKNEKEAHLAYRIKELELYGKARRKNVAG